MFFNLQLEFYTLNLFLLIIKIILIFNQEVLHASMLIEKNYVKR